MHYIPHKTDQVVSEFIQTTYLTYRPNPAYEFPNEPEFPTGKILPMIVGGSYRKNICIYCIWAIFSLLKEEDGNNKSVIEVDG